MNAPHSSTLTTGFEVWTVCCQMQQSWPCVAEVQAVAAIMLLAALCWREKQHSLPSRRVLCTLMQPPAVCLHVVHASVQPRVHQSGLVVLDGCYSVLYAMQGAGSHCLGQYWHCWQ